LSKDRPVDSPQTTALARTPLYDLHLTAGAKMVPFAGYLMPVQFTAGVLKEHLHTRAGAGLFDVSHMGQLRLIGTNAAAALETLVPGDIQGLANGAMRYTQFTDPSGGILDDLIVTNTGNDLYLVVNADCKAADLAHLQSNLPRDIAVEVMENRALLALQGPAAATVLERHAPGATRLKFMSSAAMAVMGFACFVSRCGYTGEDGFEISLAGSDAPALAAALLGEPEVAPIGLGARDSLRLEAGLCLYGQDIDTTTSPVEAGLGWSIGKRRRAEGGFPGDAVIRQQIAQGVTRKRVGLRPDGRAPARAQTPIHDKDGQHIGSVTSGGFAPTLSAPISMGYVRAELATTGTSLDLMVRSKAMAARVVAMPFTPARYHRG
jgi:aminomethyltransferase